MLGVLKTQVSAVWEHFAKVFEVSFYLRLEFKRFILVFHSRQHQMRPFWRKIPGILNTMINLYFNKWNAILAVYHGGHKAIFNHQMSTHFDFFWQEILRQWDEQAVDNIGFRFHKDKGQSVCHHPGEGPMQMVPITCQISSGFRRWVKKRL